ncbi:hypothetical protein [uncultured Bacteroides sp.]|uniref:hypothetical protein n=1 Tax=uncultured Bacteroides sp. TaxID=162156 RepID=UPI0025ECDE28|nr:hypothetical protein [uncultured Bacteroides sp.]
MENEERKKLEKEYENLKRLIEFHSTYGVIKNKSEYEKMINDILDRMNEIRKMLEKE